MAKPPVSGHTTTSDHLQTWILKVYIHCEGCKKKVFKVLQSIDGVYKTVIDAKQHTVTVTGSVNGETLVQKLLKSGKHAEILPESFGAENASGNSKKKKKQGNNKQNDNVSLDDDAEHVNEEKDVPKGMTNGEIDAEDIQKLADVTVTGGESTAGDGNGGTGGCKKKKNKKKKGDKNGNGNEGTCVGSDMEKVNLGAPIPLNNVYSTPYDLPPYNSYYPAPAYGVSYSTSYPSAESSYYTPPVYGYAQSHPSVLYPVAPVSGSYGRSVFDEHDDEGEGRWCIIM